MAVCATSWILLLILAMTTAPTRTARAQAGTVSLVTNGRPAAVLFWWGRGATRVAAFAASELSAYSKGRNHWPNTDSQEWLSYRWGGHSCLPAMGQPS